MFTRVSAAIAASTMAAASASAADLAPSMAVATSPLGLPTFYLHVGLAGLFNEPSVRISVAGAPIPGAAVKIEERATIAAEAGYFVTSRIAVSISGGFPPISKIEAAGSLNGLGAIGKTQGGPVAATVHYHFDGFGAFQPYLGTGIAALLVFGDEDRLLRHYGTENAVGPVLQAGFDLMVDERWGVFFDVKKAFVTTNTRGYLSGLPVRSTVSLDPLVLHSGLTYRF